jgi:hypothetical protein
MKAINILVCLVFLSLGTIRAHAQSAPLHYLSTVSTNCTLVQAGKVVLHDIVPINTTAVIYYLKLFNKATAPIAGTDVPVLSIPVPYGTSSSGGGAVIPSTLGYLFGLGLGFCLVGGIADNDSSNAGSGVVINFGVSTN